MSLGEFLSALCSDPSLDSPELDGVIMSRASCSSVREACGCIDDEMMPGVDMISELSSYGRFVR